MYNKVDEFKTLISQTDASLCFISESWDRSHVQGGSRLEDTIKIEGYRWVQNIVQRRKKGGKPVMLINENMFYIKEVCPDLITVPVGVEACWAVLTPKNCFSQSKIKHIAVASVYYTKSTKRTDFLDHISEAYHTLCAKYGSSLKFIISGDFNRLRIQPILNLSPDLRQLVTVVTRTNPDATLDLIISNLHLYYLSPTTFPPLSNDEYNNGKPSDHLPVVSQVKILINPKGKRLLLIDLTLTLLFVIWANGSRPSHGKKFISWKVLMRRLLHLRKCC